MNKTFSYLTILIVGVFALRLVATGELAYYINPGYIPFATLASSLCVMVGVGGVVWVGGKSVSQLAVRKLASFLKDRKLWLVMLSVALSFITLPGVILLIVVLFIEVPDSGFDKFLRQNQFYYLLVVVMLVAAWIIPAKPLGSEAAGQLTGNLNNIIASGQEPSTLSLFSFDSSKFDIGEWIKRINYDPDLDNYIGKEVNVIGFVHHPAELGEDYFLASRFVISCCAVDARPIGLPVEFPGWQGQYALDSWVQVNGKFTIQELDGERTLIISPDEITQVDQPATPYIY
ncbi:TIGR03943 family protein [Candidatus Dojkabacteria bacterium]|uniref:TIGR03943 family protein n=1 Tax=Candidatus Dojkabacteria bacterium TaxID=2099670 RepID=A0A955I7U9_9BACT|nr:TIGR03943 family protein [Candidatus Dojkabacteria bacterium]